MSGRIVIFGAGGLSLEYCEYIRRSHREILRYDDRNPMGAPGFASSEEIKPADIFYVAVGSPSVKKELVDLALKMDLVEGPALAEDSAIGRFVGLGYREPTSRINNGTVIAPMSYIGVGATVGKHCLINYGAIVSHDCRIGDFVTVSPGAIVCGDVSIGAGSYIGAGSIIRDGTSIGNGALIGCGSVVIKDVENGAAVIGNPARPTKVNKDPR